MVEIIDNRVNRPVTNANVESQSAWTVAVLVDEMNVKAHSVLVEHNVLGHPKVPLFHREKLSLFPNFRSISPSNA